MDLVSTRPPFVYSWLKIFINDLVEYVPVCTWFGWLLHISFTCQSPLIYIPSLLLLPSKNGATELSSKSSYWINYSKMRWYSFGQLLDRRHSYNPSLPALCRTIHKKRVNRGNQAPSSTSALFLPVLFRNAKSNIWFII